MEELVERFAEFISAALERGFKPPLYIAVVGANGKMMFFEYATAAEGGLTSAMLASNADDNDVIAVPVNIMITDESGKAARILIEKSKEPRFFWNGD